MEDVAIGDILPAFEATLPVTIRRTRPSEVLRLAILWKDACEEKAPGERHDLGAWGKWVIDQLENNPNFLSHVIYELDRLVGFQNCMVHYEPDRSVWQLLGMHTWVDKPHRGKGYGRRLYQEMLQAARDRGCTEFVSAGEWMSRKMHQELFGEEMRPYKTFYVGRI